jgi:CelD/BcsL family acetyltransferase involved in cellulose biosynthesis
MGKNNAEVPIIILVKFGGIMQYKLHHDFSEIDPLDWNNLLTESVTDTPFLRHEFQCAWWAHRGGGEWKQAELVLVSAREQDQLVGIAPLFLSNYAGRPALMLIGSVEISDYLDLIVRAADHPRFISGLLDFLASSHPATWSALDWYNLPDASPTLAALQAESTKRGWVFTKDAYRPTPYIPLPGDFDMYLAGIDKKQRHEIRRKLRRAEEGGRGVRWFVSDGTDLEAEIEALFKLMEEDQNKSGFLSLEMRAQMRAIIHAARKGGWLWLAFLEVDGQKAAAALNFDYNNKIWGYNAGVNRFFMDLSPGWVLLSYVLKWCCEHGRAEFDFMRGGEEYKYRFGAVDRQVMRVIASTM